MLKIKMKRIAIRAAFASCCLFVLWACATTPKEPAWVSDPYSVYNSGQYVAAVGYGSNREAAEKSALTNLTAVFGQSIKSETNFTTVYSEAIQKSSKSSWSENSDMAQAVKVSVAMDSLVGAEIKDVWDNGKGTVYTVATLDKMTGTILYSEMVNKNVSTIDSLTKLSAAEKQSFEGYAKYQQAADIADANQVLINVLKVIDPVPVIGAAAKTGDDYRLEAAEIARNIPIAVTVENDKADRIKGAFSQALTEAGFRTGGASRYNLKAKLGLEEVNFEGNQYKWVRWTVDGSLTDLTDGSVLFPYNVNGREGHSSLTEAENRAVKAAETSVKKDYITALGEFLSASSGKLK